MVAQSGGPTLACLAVKAGRQEECEHNGKNRKQFSFHSAALVGGRGSQCQCAEHSRTGNYHWTNDAASTACSSGRAETGARDRCSLCSLADPARRSGHSSLSARLAFHQDGPSSRTRAVQHEQTVAGRINSIVNIHNPSIEVHRVDRSLNTGAAVILVAGGGHKTLNVASEGADFVPFFYNYGVTTIILRNRLRHDGYNPQTDAVNDVLQSIRLVRAYAREWNIDPNKIGIMGFSAGAELTASAAVSFKNFDKKNGSGDDPLDGN